MMELIILSLLALTIILGFIGNLIFNRTNIPSNLWLLLLGLLLGQLAFVERAPLISMTEFIGTIAVITILSDGGMSLDIKKTIIDAPRGFLLMVIGLIISTGLTFAIMTAFGFSMPISLFTGLTLGGTSASVIMPVITKIKGLNERVKSILAFESIADTFTIVIAMLVLDLVTGRIPEFSIGEMINPIFSGLSIGIIIGLTWTFVLRKLKGVEYTYAATLATLILTYVVAEFFGASGAIACFCAGIILGNNGIIFKFVKPRSRVKPDVETARYHSLISFFVRTFYFVFLGAIVLIQDFMGILVGAVICVALLLSRFLYVKLFSLRDKSLTKFDLNTMSVMFPRGLSAAVLATIPLTRGISNAEVIVDIVFTVIIGTILISTVGMYFVSKTQKPKKKIKEDDEEITTE